MAVKLSRLTHKIAIQLHLVAEGYTFAVLAPDGQSGNFWIHPHKCRSPLECNVVVYLNEVNRHWE